jgi:hypothetical protein
LWLKIIVLEIVFVWGNFFQIYSSGQNFILKFLANIYNFAYYRETNSLSKFIYKVCESQKNYKLVKNYRFYKVTGTFSTFRKFQSILLVFWLDPISYVSFLIFLFQKWFKKNPNLWVFLFVFDANVHKKLDIKTSDAVNHCWSNHIFWHNKMQLWSKLWILKRDQRA